MKIHVAIVVGLILYVVLTTGVSFFMMSRVRKPADYLVAGRGLPFWALAGTIIGTCIGTGVIIGGSGLAYRHGWAGCAWPIGLGIGTLLTGLCFGKMRRYRFMTLSEEVACYYGANRIIVEFSNITIFLSQVCWLTVQIMGGAAVLGAVTGLSPKLCVALAGFAKAIITIPGGMKAVVYTDVVQTVILFCGFGALTQRALHQAGGLAGLSHSVPPEYFSFLGVDSYGLWGVISLILLMTLSVIADPGRRLTMYSAGTEKSARWSMVLSGATVMLFSVIIGIVGMFAFSLNGTMKEHPDQTLPWLVMNVLPPWLAAFVVVAVVSGMSSAANATAAASATFFVRHIFPLVTGRYPQRPLVVGRWALTVVFLVATATALFTKSIVDFAQKFLPLTMSGLAIVILLGRFWRRATWQGALAALVTTPLVSIALMNRMANATVPATLAGALALVLVSLLTRRTQVTFEKVAEMLAQERESIETSSPLAAEGTTKLPIAAKS